MSIISKILISGTISLILATVCFAGEWRSIIPLKSTRADVERQLGTPTSKSDSKYFYRRPAELVVIWFQSGPCDQSGLGWNVARGTVTTIGVIPRFVYGKEKFIDVNASIEEKANAGFVYYSNRVDGLSVETLNGRVTQVTYEPTQQQSSLACPPGNGIFDLFPKVDEYSSLSWADEKARLDNYAIRLKESMGRGLIVVYGKNARIREKLIKQTARASKYLQHRGIDPARVLVVDGGYRKQFAFELNIYLIGLMSRISLLPEKDP